MTDLTELVNSLSSLTLLEASELAKLLREKWGITETVAPLMRVPNQIVGDIEKAVEQELFNVVLKDIGPRKIEVIKVVRQVTTLGLKDAKDLTESKEPTILEGAEKAKAVQVADMLKQVGAEVALV